MAKSSSPAADLDKVIIRLPDGMRDKLKEQAKANNRSLNAEIVDRLETLGDGGLLDRLKRQADMINQLWAHISQMDKNKEFYKSLLVAERKNSAKLSIILNMIVDMIYKLEENAPQELVFLAAKITVLLHKADSVERPPEEISLSDIVAMDEWGILPADLYLPD